MGVVHEILESLDVYLYTIKRDPVNGWYFLEVGLPKTWIFRGNDIIDCKKIEIKNWKDGHLVEITPKIRDVTVDDLLRFTQLILETNTKIIEKEQEFMKKIQEVKQALTAEKDEFYKELDDLKDKSFSAFDFKTTRPPNSVNLDLNEQDDDSKRGRGRPKGSKNKTKEV